MRPRLGLESGKGGITRSSVASGTCIAAAVFRIPALPVTGVAVRPSVCVRADDPCTPCTTALARSFGSECLCCEVSDPIPRALRMTSTASATSWAGCLHGKH